MSESTTPQPSIEPTPSQTPTPSDPKPSLVNQQVDPPAPPVDPKDPPKEGEKPAEPPKVDPPVPVTIDDFKDLPNFKADDPLMKEYVDLMNKDMPAKERATELLKLQSKALNAISERGVEEFNKQTEAWVNELQSDPEYAGEKLQGALGQIGKLMTTYGSKEAREAFDSTNAGNNPHIVKFLHKVAKILNEPGADPIKARPGGGELDVASKIYDHPTSKGK